MNRHVPELDRWYLWQVVKSLDLPYQRTRSLLDRLGIAIYTDGQEYISRTEFKNLLDRI